MMEHGTIMLPVVGKSNVLGNAFAFSGSSRHAAPKLLNQHRSIANCVGDSFGRGIASLVAGEQDERIS